MVDVSIVNKTSPEANWNRQAGRQAGGLTNLGVGRHAPPKMNQKVFNGFHKTSSVEDNFYQVTPLSL